MEADFCVYPALAVATSLYALVLDDNKQRAPAEKKIEPDWTWLEVVVGTSLCLLAAAIRVRIEPGSSWRSYERAVWKAFATGGAPIIAWQVWRALERQRRRGDTLHYYVETNHADDHKRPPTPMAALRRAGASANRADC